MATTANLLTLLKYYASKQKSPMIEYSDFAEYLHRYSQHHLEENSDLVIYCGTDYAESMETELNKFISSRQIVVAQHRGKDYIFLVPFYIEHFNSVYKNIEQNVSIPFPVLADIQKSAPQNIVTHENAADIIYRLLEKEDLNDKFFYCIDFSKDLPSLLFPSLFPMRNLVNIALRKVHSLMQKEESHDYFQKKLCVSNPGKELSIKSFIQTFCENPIAALDQLQTSGDTFFYWSQFCYFLKQDYQKLKDYTSEDISLLQSVAIIELATSFYKSKTAERLQKENAFKILDSLMLNPPYYFNWSDIIKFKDGTGVLLVDQYTEAELKEHLTRLSQETVGNQMPLLLIFKVNDTEGYYIRKEKLMSLVIKLCNDSRTLIRTSISKKWTKCLLAFETLPEMKESPAFEACLEREVRDSNPILYALLNASFLPVVAYEDKTPGKLSLFRNGTLIPYSELLMISRQEIYTDARIKLPFWYTIPVISWIISLFMKKPKKKDDKQKQSEISSVTLNDILDQKETEEEKFKKKNNEEVVYGQKSNHKKELRNAAAALEKIYVPENSTMDRELKGYMHEWNDRIGKENYDNLREDIDSLIRDYLRKVLRTIKSESFTQERVESLASSLVDSPSMMKIKNHPALQRYVVLYLIKLVKNLP